MYKSRHRETGALFYMQNLLSFDSINRTTVTTARNLVADRENLDVVRGVPGASSLELVTTEVSSNLASGGVLGLAEVVGVDVEDNGRRILDDGLVAVVELQPGVLMGLNTC